MPRSDGSRSDRYQHLAGTTKIRLYRLREQVEQRFPESGADLVERLAKKPQEAAQLCAAQHEPSVALDRGHRSRDRPSPSAEQRRVTVKDVRSTVASDGYRKGA